jgi:hypothetical protein
MKESLKVALGWGEREHAAQETSEAMLNGSR